MEIQLSEGFQPDWASAPGNTIRDVLRERNVSIDDFARWMDQSREDTVELLQGRSAITIQVARRLEKALGASVEFWMSREFRYRQQLEKPTIDESAWLKTLPIADMVEFGWLRPAPKPSETLSACLRFFGVPNIATWNRVYGRLAQHYSFRTSPSFESVPGALLAWLRQGEIQGEAVDCAPWNPLAFKSALTSVRGLTREKDPNQFVPKLQNICSQSGVAVVIVRTPKGSRASGATRFLSENKGLLLLSFRHLSDDQFWFSFFHEAGHLLLHDARDLFVEGIESAPPEKEQEANNFAFEVLIPSEFQQEFYRLPAKPFELARFARRIGVSTGIVVGQMQHHGKIKPKHFNRLKRWYEWS
jgi:HTH-type transcriptional regulator / antitoxin HigA